MVRQGKGGGGGARPGGGVIRQGRGEGIPKRVVWFVRCVCVRGEAFVVQLGSE